MEDAQLLFQDSNRLRFERPVDATGRDWWRAAFLEPHGLSPEGLADLITRSIISEKSVVYRYIDGIAHAFALRVEGRFQDVGDVWFVERSLDLDGAAFSADQMFIPSGDAGIGRGRRLMGDLMQAAELLGLSRIGIEAERIGRYAWLRAGFIPDRGSWRNIQLEAFRFVQRHMASLGGEGSEILSRLASAGPALSRWLAALDVPVQSREVFGRDGHPVMLPFGKAFFLEAAPNWTGAFMFDPESRRVAAAYIEGHAKQEIPDAR